MPAKLYKNWLIDRLNQPLPHLRDRSHNWGFIIGVSIFISLFLWFFRPFGLGQINREYTELIIIGYGGVTFVILTLFTILLPGLIKHLFPEKKWTVWKHIIWVTILLLTIGIGNYIYTYACIGMMSWNWKVFLDLQVFTVVIGIIPISITTLIDVNRKLKNNLAIATSINQKIEHKETGDKDKSKILTITGKNKNDALTIAEENLYYICSEGNYVRVYYKDQTGTRYKMLRNTLHNIKIQLQGINSVTQCHRAYLVNTAKITKAEGNAQGFKLTIDELNETIPVSRKYVPLVKGSISI